MAEILTDSEVSEIEAALQGFKSRRLQLVHTARVMFETRLAKYNDPRNEEWNFDDITDKWERHAWSAYLDLIETEKIAGNIPRLIESHRRLAAERDNDVRNRQHCEDEVYELQQRLKVKTELLDKAMVQVCAENAAKVELESRIRTLELACEAARKLFVGLVPELGRAEDVEAMIKRLEGAIKHVS